MAIGMSARELANRLTEMARELRRIRKNDEGGWVTEVQEALKTLERALLEASFDLDD